MTIFLTNSVFSSDYIIFCSEIFLDAFSTYYLDGFFLLFIDEIQTSPLPCMGFYFNWCVSVYFMENMRSITNCIVHFRSIERSALLAASILPSNHILVICINMDDQYKVIIFAVVI